MPRKWLLTALFGLLSSAGMESISSADPSNPGDVVPNFYANAYYAGTERESSIVPVGCASSASCSSGASCSSCASSPTSCSGGCGNACTASGGCGGGGCNCGFCGGGILGGGLLGGLIKPTSSCFGCFISPMTNPVFFEDPRTLTEARFIYLHHKVPLAAAGGDVDLLALQLRFALTDRLSLIATKDGFVMSSNPLIEDGWADVAAGLKYNLYADVQSQSLLSAGATYEMPVGTPRTRQGNGDGLFNMFLTGGRAIGQGHWISATGLWLPVDTAAESSLWYWSNHFDRRLAGPNLYFINEYNLYHYTKSGDGGLPGIEGGDLINFGSTNVRGNDIVTGAIGLKYRPSFRREIGLAWEYPLTAREDVLDNRLTFDAIVRF